MTGEVDEENFEVTLKLDTGSFEQDLLRVEQASASMLQKLVADCDKLVAAQREATKALQETLVQRQQDLKAAHPYLDPFAPNPTVSGLKTAVSGTESNSGANASSTSATEGEKKENGIGQAASTISHLNTARKLADALILGGPEGLLAAGVTIGTVQIMGNLVSTLGDHAGEVATRAEEVGTINDVARATHTDAQKNMREYYAAREVGADPKMPEFNAVLENRAQTLQSWRLYGEQSQNLNVRKLRALHLDPEKILGSANPILEIAKVADYIRTHLNERAAYEWLKGTKLVTSGEALALSKGEGDLEKRYSTTEVGQKAFHKVGDADWAGYVTTANTEEEDQKEEKANFDANHRVAETGLFDMPRPWMARKANLGENGKDLWLGTFGQITNPAGLIARLSEMPREGRVLGDPGIEIKGGKSLLAWTISEIYQSVAGAEQAEKPNLPKLSTEGHQIIAQQTQGTQPPAKESGPYIDARPTREVANLPADLTSAHRPSILYNHSDAHTAQPAAPAEGYRSMVNNYYFSGPCTVNTQQSKDELFFGHSHLPAPPHGPMSRIPTPLSNGQY